ncbi:hypothetical protein [Pseudomonas citronellolis]|uniref:hypothetical protein n=1 Tax=Pseudomonas citronellolis TaxID=53408 RepID=UPI00389A9A3F
MTMAMELIRHIAGLYGGKAIKGDITQVYITGNEIWMAQQVLAEQAEGAQGDLWAVHAKGPDDLYAAFSREDAEKHAAELNALPMPKGIAVSAVVVASPWPAAEHWKYLAEQEREHNGALVAQAGQVPEECAPGTYAIDYLDNWDGEGDRYFCIAEKTADGKWIRQESGQELLEYKGDAILAAWLLAASEAQERDK